MLTAPTQPRGHHELPFGARTVGQGAPGQRHPLGEPDEPAARPGQCGGGRAGQRVAHVDLQTLAGPAAQRHGGRRARGVLVHVRQRLLHDAVGSAAQRARGSVRLVDVHPELHRRPRTPGLLDQLRDVPQRGGRRVRGRPLAEHADHVTQLLERLAGAGPDDAGGAAHLVGRQVRPHLETAGVQRDEGHPVREDLVHLPGDAGPLGMPRLLGEQPLLGLGTLGTFPQRGDELAPGPGEHAPGQHRRVERGGPQHLLPLAVLGGRPQRHDGHRGRRDVHGDHRQHQTRPPARRSGEHPGQARDRRGGRQCSRQGQRQRQPERPPPPQQGHAGGDTEGDVDDEHGPRPGVQGRLRDQ